VTSQLSNAADVEKIGRFRAWALRALDLVERIGNRLPDPLTLFALCALLVVFASALVSWLGVTVVHPGTGETVGPVNLLSKDGTRRMLTDAVVNFTAFPPLGTVLVAMLGIGVAERSGMITAALKQMVAVVPRSAITAALLFTGVNASVAADAGFVVLLPLGAVLFAGLGRHPLAGLAAAFAGVSGGFSANLFLTSLDPLLSGLTDPAAKMVNPQYEVLPTANYYFMVVSVFLITAVGTYVTERIVEPRLGAYRRVDAEGESEGGELGMITPREKKALLASAVTAILLLIVVAGLTMGPEAILRSPEGDLKPFYGSLITLLMILFFVPGLVYGCMTGSIKSDSDVARMSADTMGTMGAYIVLAFMAAQFVAYFSWSNLGLITAVSGAELLKSLGISGLPLLLALLVVGGGINLLIGSASAKWAILAPVFVPMFMLMGFSPELVQVTYRVGDSVTNVISPLLPYYPMVIVFAQRYQPKIRLGTLLSIMLPYSVALGIAWSLMIAVWVTLGVPLGPGAPLTYPG
jgi:aminobenzoyl-glutamate transport protein